MRTNKPGLVGWVIVGGIIVTMGMAGADDRRPQGNWILTTGEDPESYATVVSLQQDSATSIKDEYATHDVVPQLVFRCRPGDPTVTARIDWGRFISSFNTEVGFKIDDGKRAWLKWGVDRSEKITVSPSVVDSQKLISQMMGGKKLEVEVSPYSEGPVTALYDLAAFDEALQELLASCQ